LTPIPPKTWVTKRGRQSRTCSKPW
jgi:hypothetical protein